MHPLLVMAAALSAQSPAEFFESRVRPVLAKNCHACHTKSEMGGLRLDSRVRVLRGGKSGPAVIPGNAGESLLIQAVEHRHERLKMPPQTRLTPAEITDLRTWIAGGAVFPEGTAIKADPRSFWSFQPVRKPDSPRVSGSWAVTNIDRFVLAGLERAGLAPSKAAGRRTLIRRVTFDLTGLPPTPVEVADFANDSSAGAFPKVIGRLLASPHYGERWARHWLDLARYSDGQQGAREDTPYPNAFRYRDWVVKAFNDDLPYDIFVKAQIAADHFPDARREAHLAALGFQTIGESDNDRVDVTTRVFLGLTAGCAQCHDHKFDPIPTRDYYSLLGVFKSSKVDQHALAPPATVAAHKKATAVSAEKQAELKAFTDRQIAQVTEILASQTSRYLMAVWRGASDPELDAETFERWRSYLKDSRKEHPFFDPWFALLKRGDAGEGEVRDMADRMQQALRSILAEKKTLDDRNYVKLGGIEGMKDTAKVIKTLVDALPIERYYFWRDMASQPLKVEDIRFAGGVYYYSAKDVERFLDPRWKRYYDQLRAEAAALKKAIPELYPFYHVLRDVEKPRNIKVAIRGDAENPGEEAPRRFLSVLSDGEPRLFTTGSGRMELAEAIAGPSNPLTARVIVNRLWKHHFGEGLVRSTSNFGQLGDRPTHPELLDYLAARLVESGWSLKALHREMLLSAAYQMTSEESREARDKDPENKLLSHANLRERLDAESLRDAVLAVAGTLDITIGGAPKPLTDDFRGRTLYGTVSRSQPDRTMATFDFPDPNASSESRMVTVGPAQRLYFMNSSFVAKQSRVLARRAAGMGSTDKERIGRLYELLYGRPAIEEEIRLGEAYLAGQSDAWPRYAQVLLSAAEFSTVQ